MHCKVLGHDEASAIPSSVMNPHVNRPHLGQDVLRFHGDAAGSADEDETRPSPACRSVVCLWAPLLGWALALLVLLAPRFRPLEPGSGWPGQVRLEPDRHRVVFISNLLLLPGNALAITWFLGLSTLTRNRMRTEARTTNGSWTTDLAAAGVATVAGGSFATLALASVLGGEQTLAMALCIYAPSLLAGYGLLRVASFRIRAGWQVVLAGLGLAVSMLATQLLYLEPDGRPPSEAVFALASLPILLSVAVWLTASLLPPRHVLIEDTR